MRPRAGFELSWRSEDPRSREIESHWAGLSEAERIELEERAVAGATGFAAKQYRDGKGRGGALFQAARQAIIDAEIRKVLERRAPATDGGEGAQAR